MPKRRRRSHPLSRHRPLTFSPFSRSMAMAASCKRTRTTIKEPKLKDVDFASSSGNGFVDEGRHDSDCDSSDSEGFEGFVQADFVFFDPKPTDFHGVKVLLQAYLDNKEWDLSGFVDLILGQPTVGTVVKIENDEDDGVYSCISCLNLGRHKDHKCIIQLKDYLVKTLHDRDLIANLMSLVVDHVHDVGLVVSQRVVNLPTQLLPPLYDALFDEIEWATEDEPSKELQDSFRFKFYLFISKIYKHKNADQNKGRIPNGEDAIIYTKPEDEILLELSSWSFSFPLHSQWVATNELKNYRPMGLVMAVDASKVPAFRTQLRSLMAE